MRWIRPLAPDMCTWIVSARGHLCLAHLVRQNQAAPHRTSLWQLRWPSPVSGVSCAPSPDVLASALRHRSHCHHMVFCRPRQLHSGDAYTSSPLVRAGTSRQKAPAANPVGDFFVWPISLHAWMSGMEHVASCRIGWIASVCTDHGKCVPRLPDL